MNVSTRQKTIVFFAWLLIVPPSFLIARTYFPTREIDWINIAILFAILFVTILMPLQIENVTISLERWITLTIFLQYGVFAELVITQLALFILVLSNKNTVPLLHRFFVNSSIFALVSFGSGFIFHIAGGSIGSLDFSSIVLFSLLYTVIYTLLNTLLLKIYFFFNKRSFSLFRGGALWNYMMTMVLLPFSVALYFMYALHGDKSILLVGIPFLIVLLVIRRYTLSSDLNEKLTYASDIGRELADRLRFVEVLENFIVKLKAVVAYKNAYVIDYRLKEEFILLMGYENDRLTTSMSEISISLKKDDYEFDLDQSKVFYNRKAVNKLQSIRFITPVESVLTVPIKRNGQTEGLLLLTSSEKNSFKGIDVQIVGILAGYLAISLEKARYFERTIEKSERCALTKLHNYRYLDSKLDEEITRYYTGEMTSLSAIIMDIDHFKKVNDTYGHESGNTILNKLARILENHIETHETLARYGGEEFVLLLPNCTKVEAIERAETIRVEVERTLFTIVPDLSENLTPIEIQITVSIGVASIPEDAEDARNLMRNADRALYIGGKQAGRNQVGVYEAKKVVNIN